MKRFQTALTLLLGSALALSACTGSDPDPAPPSAAPNGPTTPPRIVDGVSTTGRGPELPEKSAWLGAWVKPDWQTSQGRVAALAAFADQTGGAMPLAHTFHEWEDDFPGPVQQEFQAVGKLQMISWSGTDTRDIRDGGHDQLIRQRAESIKQFGAPLLLRWRWEMDRPNLRQSVHTPDDYIAAWKRIRGIFTEVGATNAAFVWCPHVQGFTDPKRNAAAYYPGDDQVDWLCTDVYPGRRFDGFTEQMDTFMTFAAQHPRPIVIGEFGVTYPGEPGQRGAWLREAGDYVKRHPQIKAAVYFAAKQTKPAYDSTFDDDPEGLAAFRELAADPWFSAPPPSPGPR
ncbi:glycoside hydrolase family 26 protein [Micromonospora okii]|uniref:glycoside hydrolase family 26 protein n=1 Tax=Micromonospora okii TaxID=1182970 RepID=UPI001E546FE8|nr:beta-mannanase [Micromonospora okii]